MPDLFSEIDLRRQFNAPDFTRTRHKARAPRESSKINLETDQLAYSIHKLANRSSDFREKFRNRASDILSGGTEEYEYNDVSVTVPGLLGLAERLNGVKKRVDSFDMR